MANVPSASAIKWWHERYVAAFSWQLCDGEEMVDYIPLLQSAVVAVLADPAADAAIGYKAVGRCRQVPDVGVGLEREFVFYLQSGVRAVECAVVVVQLIRVLTVTDSEVGRPGDLPARCSRVAPDGWSRQGEVEKAVAVVGGERVGVPARIGSPGEEEDRRQDVTRFLLYRRGDFAVCGHWHDDGIGWLARLADRRTEGSRSQTGGSDRSGVMTDSRWYEKQKCRVVVHHGLRLVALGLMSLQLLMGRFKLACLWRRSV